MTAAERVKARRDRLRLERKCLCCRAGLQETDVILCVECVDKRTEAQARYEAKNPNRVRNRSKPSPERMVKAATKKRQRYNAKAQRTECTRDGCANRPVQGEKTCKSCRARARIISRDSFRRKTWPRILALNLWRAGVAPYRSAKGRLPAHMRLRAAKQANRPDSVRMAA